MPSITEFLTGPAQGWEQGVGPNFYYPPGEDIPHLHLTVANAQSQINDYSGLRAPGTITYFGLTHLRPPHPNIRLTDAPEDVISDALQNNWAGDELMAVQFRINSITGRGIDV